MWGSACLKVEVDICVCSAALSSQCHADPAPLPCSLTLHACKVDNDYKLHVYLRIGALYLEDGDAVTAETFINRGSVFAADTQQAELQFKFKVGWGGSG